MAYSRAVRGVKFFHGLEACNLVMATAMKTKANLLTKTTGNA
jgi:hypothetical protein